MHQSSSLLGLILNNIMSKKQSASDLERIVSLAVTRGTTTSIHNYYVLLGVPRYPVAVMSSNTISRHASDSFITLTVRKVTKRLPVSCSNDDMTLSLSIKLLIEFDFIINTCRDGLQLKTFTLHFIVQ